ncbi:MAG TPA: hypothetical protein VGJ87_07725 [Roseiflexaceae bacterium]|jgi:hypothetical protein
MVDLARGKPRRAAQGRTASRLHLTAAAVIGATLVGAAVRAASRIVLLRDATSSQQLSLFALY